MFANSAKSAGLAQAPVASPAPPDTRRTMARMAFWSAGERDGQAWARDSKHGGVCGTKWATGPSRQGLRLGQCGIVSARLRLFDRFDRETTLGDMSFHRSPDSLGKL